MSHKTITVDIAGMHCLSCEILLEKKIGKIDGVRDVKTDFKKGIAVIECGDGFDIATIEGVVRGAGYLVGKEAEKNIFSRQLSDYIELAATASVLFVVYAFLKMYHVFDFSLTDGQTSGLFGVLLVGLTAGVSSCMALIGGLVLGVSARHAEAHPEAGVAEKFRPHIFFNAGRLISYALLGGVIGALGSAFKLSTSVFGIVTIILGFVMLFLGLKLIDIFPRLKNTSFTLPKRVTRFFGIQKEMKEYSHRSAFIVGALTFFVPCGFTQTMQLYAISTGSFIQGACIMGVFALGTMPGIVCVGGLTSVIKGSFARYFFRFSGLIVILLAVFSISNGWTLADFSLPSLPTFKISRVDSEIPVARGVVSDETSIEKGKQIIEMTQSGGGYGPAHFTIKKGVPVLWKIKSINQYTCAAYILMPDAGISKPLVAGENSIEFTPNKTGIMHFTCSMGMYSGYFTVID